MSWRESPLDEGPEPSDIDYEVAEERIIFTNFYETALYEISKGQQPTDEHHMQLKKSEKYQDRLAEMAYELMEERHEDMKQDNFEERDL